MSEVFFASFAAFFATFAVKSSCCSPGVCKNKTFNRQVREGDAKVAKKKPFIFGYPEVLWNAIDFLCVLSGFRDLCG
jgi:hypothetical protein